MSEKSTNKWVLAIIIVAVFILATGLLSAQRPKTPVQLNPPASRTDRQMERLSEEVRHHLVMMPYYSVFDWIQAEVKPDGSVTLTGEVTRPSLKEDAEDRVGKIESATRVVNRIEVLPLSPVDNDLRVALYRAIFSFNSPLFRYATQSVPPIHIIVKNGRVTLKGIVANQADSQLAEMAARGVSGIFEVRNELKIEQRLDEKVTRK
jgi:hyperosmotically inducible periplasmic protein